MSACVARDLGFTLKRGLGQLYFFISFLFLFFHVVAVHSAPICLLYMSVCCTEIDFDIVFNSILNKHCDRDAFNLYEGFFPSVKEHSNTCNMHSNKWKIKWGEKKHETILNKKINWTAT